MGGSRVRDAVIGIAAIIGCFSAAPASAETAELRADVVNVTASLAAPLATAVAVAVAAVSIDGPRMPEPSRRGPAPTAAETRRAPPPPPNVSAVDQPLLLVVGLSEQRVNVFRGRMQLASAPVSTGRRGYDTPAGVYSILEKNRVHFSNLYDDAPMPFMQRITWSGIALHAGRVPGYPASHGCIRLPHSFARELFAYSELGATVVVASKAVAPAPIRHDALFQPSWPRLLAHADARLAEVEPVNVLANGLPLSAAFDIEADLDRLRAYQRRSPAPLRVLITRRTGRERILDIQRLLHELGYDPGAIDGAQGRATGAAIRAFQRDRGETATGMVTEELIDALHAATGEPKTDGHLYVRQDHQDLFDAPVILEEPDAPIGTHYFLAMDFAEGDAEIEWSALTLAGDDQNTAAAALDRVGIPDALRARIEALLTPGSTLIVSDAGRGRETGRGTDFIVQP